MCAGGVKSAIGRGAALLRLWLATQIWRARKAAKALVIDVAAGRSDFGGPTPGDAIRCESHS
jgi:hypothetical protein